MLVGVQVSSWQFAVVASSYKMNPVEGSTTSGEMDPLHVIPPLRKGQSLALHPAVVAESITQKAIPQVKAEPALPQ